jgi:hypothetical protein
MYFLPHFDKRSQAWFYLKVVLPVSSTLDILVQICALCLFSNVILFFFYSIWAWTQDFALARQCSTISDTHITFFASIIFQVGSYIFAQPGLRPLSSYRYVKCSWDDRYTQWYLPSFFNGDGSHQYFLSGLALHDHIPSFQLLSSWVYRHEPFTLLGLKCHFLMSVKL